MAPDDLDVAEVDASTAAISQGWTSTPCTGNSFGTDRQKQGVRYAVVVPTSPVPVRGPANIPAIVISRQEVEPMHAESAVGAPMQDTIPRLT